MSEIAGYLGKITGEGGGGSHIKISTTLPDPVEGVSTLVEDTEYYLEEIENLNVAFPEGHKGKYILLKFSSGDTATQLIINGENVVGDTELVPQANRTYQVLADFDGTHWVITYRAY